MASAFFLVWSGLRVCLSLGKCNIGLGKYKICLLARLGKCKKAVSVGSWGGGTLKVHKTLLWRNFGLKG